MIDLSINYIMRIRHVKTFDHLPEKQLKHEAHHDEKHDENVMRIYGFFLFMKLDK